MKSANQLASTGELHIDSPMSSSSVDILLAHGMEITRKNVQDEIEKLGHNITKTSSTTAETINHCRDTPPQLIVSGLHFPDGDGIDALITISEFECIPSIVVTTVADLDRVEKAMDDHVMAYLIDPVTSDDLKASIHLVLRRFEQFQELNDQVDDLKGALETRKKLERAKGILMANEGITEEEAYLQIRSAATSNRVKIADIADQIIEKQQIPGKDFDKAS
ncbi:MAG: hypothetical protein CMO55_07170 [Verrucomicrobiales bacterium]|nr:hypothetical protein [Verrucomicrobiales bacterium]